MSYEPTDSSQPPTIASTGLEICYTTENNLELGTEFIFSVTAFTQVGRGETASIVVSTLTRPCEKCFVTVSVVIIIIPIFICTQLL